MGIGKSGFISNRILVLLLVVLPLCYISGIDSSTAATRWSVKQANVSRHIVRPGETLNDIAQSYGFESADLALFNRISNPNKLLAGQTIYLPDMEAPQGNSQSVNVGDLPPHGVPAEELIQLYQFSGRAPAFHSSERIDYNHGVDPSLPAPQLGMDAPVTHTDHHLEKADEMSNPSEQVTESFQDEQMSQEMDEGDMIADSDSPALTVFDDRPYSYYASGEPLADTLQNFAASYTLPTVIDEAVTGVVNGKIGPFQPVDFLDHMANIYGFIWYFDGHSLYIYGGHAAEQKIISLEYMSTGTFKDTLKKVGIWDGRFFWKEQPNEGLVYVSGPPRYVDAVVQTAALLDKKEGDRQKSKLTVKMFKLKYAWATDKTFNFRGKDITVPGVATLLESIISGGGIASVNSEAQSSQGMSSVKPAKSLGQNSAQKHSDGMQQAALNAGAKAEGSYISADPRLNAIIVHDLESKMPMYEGLIESLDKPSSQVEVSVSIIDVNTEDIEALGVEWGNSRGIGRSEAIFNPTNSKHTSNLSTYTTVLELNLRSFNAKLNLLEDEGRAKVVSRPSILTLDNLEAVFDNSSTFYARVTSQDDAKLFPVTSGTVVQVTPRIVVEDKGRRIHMSVNIQDGSQTSGTDSQVDNLPKVNNSSISTQAVVSENESLLIGGFYKETQNKKTTKVPVLGDIPVMGQLFRSEYRENVSQVRLFLITPRILNTGA